MTAVMRLLGAKASGFDPMSLTPDLWLDASDTATITSSSGAVSQWDDKSGNGRHVSSSGSERPKTGSATQNGLNVLTFDGISSVLLKNSSVTVPTTYTIAIVATPTTGTNDYLFSFKSTANVGQTGIISGYSSKAYEFFQTTPGSARFTLGASNATGCNTNIVVHNGTSVSSLVNGASSGSSSSGASSSLSAGRITVGNYDQGGGGNAAGSNIAEIVVYFSALSGANLTGLSNYLRTKWGTP